MTSPLPIGSGSSRSTPLHRSGRLTVLGALVLLACVLAFAWSLSENYRRARSTQAQSALLAALEQVVATVTTVQSSQRGYVLSGSDAFLDPYREAKAEFD